MLDVPSSREGRGLARLVFRLLLEGQKRDSLLRLPLPLLQYLQGMLTMHIGLAYSLGCAILSSQWILDYPPEPFRVSRLPSP